MKKVLIIGSGAAGCAAARSLSEAGIPMLMIEKEKEIGGKTAAYGCKATDSCTQCGVCLTGPLFEQIKEAPGLEIMCNTSLCELFREENGFTAILEKTGKKLEVKVSQIFVASGFSHLPIGDSGNLRISGSGRILYGEQLEAALRKRTANALFDTVPNRVGFVFCFGSRNPAHGVNYCSKICCGYATRSAKALKSIYPDMDIAMFFMDLQSVKAGNYLQEMRDAGFEMIRCRPNRIDASETGVQVFWEDRDGVHKKELDMCILCGGVRPNADNGLLAELTGLSVNEDGFLETVLAPEQTGIWVAGTARGPMSISETMADAKVKAACMIRCAEREVSA